MKTQMTKIKTGMALAILITLFQALGHAGGGPIQPGPHNPGEAPSVILDCNFDVAGQGLSAKNLHYQLLKYSFGKTVVDYTTFPEPFVNMPDGSRIVRLNYYSDELQAVKIGLGTFLIGDNVTDQGGHLTYTKLGVGPATLTGFYAQVEEVYGGYNTSGTPNFFHPAILKGLCNAKE